MSTAEIAKSKGHICFTSDNAVEFFAHGGEVYRAPTSAPLADMRDRKDPSRHGRWECTVAHFERFRSVVVW